MQKYYTISKMICYLLAIGAITCLLAVIILNITGNKFVILTTITAILAISSSMFFILKFSPKTDHAAIYEGSTKKESGTVRKLGD